MIWTLLEPKAFAASMSEGSHSVNDCSTITPLLSLQAHELQKLPRTRFGLYLIDAADPHGIHDVLQHGLLLEQAEVLEDHADVMTGLVQLLASEVGDVLPIDDDLTAGRTLEQVDATDQRGLARTGLADDAEHIAIIDGQVDVEKCLELAFPSLIDLVYVLDFDYFDPFMHTR